MQTTSSQGQQTGALSAPDHELLTAVLAYQHDPLVGRIMKELGIEEPKARQIFEDTKRFLFICGTCNGKWSPSMEIDEGWHNFIMFTQDYADFCNRFFGRFIHHVPNLPGETPDKSRPRRTLVAAIQLFGKENLSECWVYRNKSGKPVLGPSVAIDDMIAIEALDPCGQSCGCNASCNDE